MITAVDTSVLLDVFGGDPTYGPRSAAALRACLAEGRLVACAVVWAEVGGFFPSSAQVQEVMARLGIQYDVILLDAALEASTAWKVYRQRGGHRLRMIPDFLIGAHALHQAERLLTRDRGFYRTSFSKLVVLDPTAPTVA